MDNEHLNLGEYDLNYLAGTEDQDFRGDNTRSKNNSGINCELGNVQLMKKDHNSNAESIDYSFVLKCLISVKSEQTDKEGSASDNIILKLYYLYLHRGHKNCLMKEYEQ